MKKNTKPTREIYPVIANLRGFLLPGWWYFSWIGSKTVNSFSWVLATSFEIPSEFRSPFPSGKSLMEKKKVVFLILESPLLLQTEERRICCVLLRKSPGCFSGQIASPLFRTGVPRGSAYFPFLSGTATTHAASRAPCKGVRFTFLSASYRIPIIGYYVIICFSVLMVINTVKWSHVHTISICLEKK